MIQLRAYVKIKDLQNQLAAYLGSQARARGLIPTPSSHVQFLDVTPASERLLDAIFKTSGNVKLARQGSLLELHAKDTATLNKASNAALKMAGVKATDAPKPQQGLVDIIEGITDQHAMMLNRSRRGSMVTPGESLLIYEVSPAPFAVLAANEAERVSPDTTLVDLQETGGAGRLYLSGSKAQLEKAREHINNVMKTG